MRMVIKRWTMNSLDNRIVAPTWLTIRVVEGEAKEKR
jgi:hypothetical protein